MEISRRNFLVGSTILIAGLAVQDAISMGRVYSFPTKIRLANSLSDSKYFVTIDEPVDDRRAITNFGVRGAFKINEESSWKVVRRVRREIFDREEFYNDRLAFPIKVEYLSDKNGSLLTDGYVVRMHDPQMKIVLTDA